MYYVTKERSFYVLRQERYKQVLLAGREHPHDTMAYARTPEEMSRMVRLITETAYVDWSGALDAVNANNERKTVK